MTAATAENPRASTPTLGPESVRNLRRRIREEAKRHLAPPPRLAISEWADRERYLSPEASAMPGKWRTDQVEPARGVMDAVSDPAVHTVTAMVCTQLLKTETLNNVVGYHIHQDPAPILVIQPTAKPMAEAWSKDRFAPMARDTPALRGKLGTPKTRDSENTILHKKFAGGHLTVVGANAPASLSSRPIRIVLADEVDRYEGSAKAEGDPIRLAAKRQETFWNRKLVLTSSPTLKGASRIEASFQGSDRRRYFVPCPHCGDCQDLRWTQVQWPEGRPEEAAYCCETCGALWSEADRLQAVQRGEWRQTAAFVCCATEQEPAMWGEPDAAGCRRALCWHCGEPAPFKGHAGFHLNRLASPWTTVAAFAQEFLEAKREGPESLKVWTNTGLAETWEEQGEGVAVEPLLARREDYPPSPVPPRVLALTAGVDVQGDRLELELVGWGVSEESWSLDYRVLYGDPSGSALWAELDEVLAQRYQHPLGPELRIEAVCVDSGGHHTQAVYDYCRPRYGRVFAVKGQPGAGRPIWPESANKNMAKRLPVFMVGVDNAKDLLYNRLQILAPGPGYCHFPARYGRTYFEGLTAEQKRTRLKKGFPVTEWVLPSGVRNEPLDCRVYALAARRAKNLDLEGRARALERSAREGNPTQTTLEPPRRRRGVRHPGLQRRAPR